MKNFMTEFALKREPQTTLWLFERDLTVIAERS